MGLIRVAVEGAVRNVAGMNRWFFDEGEGVVPGGMSNFVEVTQEAGAAFVRRGIEGPVVMLNLLRFREVADYGGSPELAPEGEVSGRDAYDRYMEHTRPFLEGAGGTVLFAGEAERFLIGPPEGRWDLVLVVRHASVAAFLGFARNEGYLAGAGHRTAALLDSRLLPMCELSGD